MGRRKRKDSESAPNERQMYTCGLCQREVGHVNRHHLVPKSEGGIETVDLCSACHKTLHSFFTNRTLSESLNTIKTISAEPEIARYLAWVRKQREGRIKVAMKKSRR